MTQRASSRGHVLDGSTHGPNGSPLISRQRSTDQVPSSVDVDDTTSELIVTFLGIFPLFDEFVGCSLLVTYVWLECVDFFLELIKSLLIVC